MSVIYMFLGGYINSHKVLKYIKSLGFEMETSDISKFSQSDENPSILINTDSKSGDIAELKNIKALLEAGDEEGIEDIPVDTLQRLPEIFDLKELGVVERQDVQDRKIQCMITNDITTSSPYFRHLEDMHKKINGNAPPVDIPEDEFFDYKNSLYEFKTAVSSKDYSLNFVSSELLDVHTFADVEWIFTYYKPEISPNIILDTFMKSLKIVLNHLSHFTAIPGHLHIEGKPDDIATNLFKHNDIVSDGKDAEPVNLYYLQTKKRANFSLDDVYITTQLTFSARIHDIYNVMTYLVQQKQTIVDELALTKNSYDIITTVYKITHELLHRYQTRNTNVLKYGDIDVVCNYLFLILYKIYVYIFIFDAKTTEYLKNKMTFNARHDNYELYDVLKGNLRNAGINAAKMIHNIVMNADVLHKYQRMDKYLTQLDPSDDRYGDPSVSIPSYFDFLETQSKCWFVNQSIDGFSTRIPLDRKRNIVFLEFRGFQYQLFGYMYPYINDVIMKSDIKNRTVSVGTLRLFAFLYEEEQENKPKLRNTMKYFKKIFKRGTRKRSSYSSSK